MTSPDMDWSGCSPVSPIPGQRMGKNYGIMILTKEQSKALVPQPKEMETDKVPDKEFKIIVSRKLNRIQENTTK